MSTAGKAVWDHPLMTSGWRGRGGDRERRGEGGGGGSES